MTVPGPAKNLISGSSFLLANGSAATLAEISVEEAAPGQTFSTYNFEVEDYHTYFAGNAGVWVHNKGAFCDRVASLFIHQLKKTDDPYIAYCKVKKMLPKIAGGAYSALVEKTISNLDELYNTNKLSDRLRELAYDRYNNKKDIRELLGALNYEKKTGNLLRRSGVGEYDFIEELANGTSKKVELWGPPPAEFFNDKHVIDSVSKHMTDKPADALRVFDLSGLDSKQKHVIHETIRWHHTLNESVDVVILGE